MPHARPSFWLASSVFAVACTSGCAPAPSAPAGATPILRAAPSAAPAPELVEAALAAMGGRARLAALRTVRTDVAKHTLLMEQSYRQAPFITAYERDKVLLDLAGKHVRVEAHGIWPEADPGTAESDAILIGSPDAAVYRGKSGDAPGRLADIEASRAAIELGPLTMLLAASAAPDLRREKSETIRATLDDVVGFTWRGVSAKIAINPFTHLPDALETKTQFNDFWFYWGDVDQKIYFDNWRLEHGIRYPSTEVEERNGTAWESRQTLSMALDEAAAEASFQMDAAAAAKSAQSKGWNRAFAGGAPAILAPGVELYAGSWNVAVVVQRDGIVLLEAPISGPYLNGIVADARSRHPGLPIKAVVTTSDSWPHVGAVRSCVASGFPLYVLDVNRPLVERFLAAPHTLAPDELAARPDAKPALHVVSGAETIGDGDNQLVLYPIRGAATERQFMVYFPHHKILYASDTLVLNDDHSLYAPELVFEVAQAVAREHLDVERVYAMHQEPLPWKEAAALVEKASAPAQASGPG